jgi:hypothetical protein
MPKAASLRVILLQISKLFDYIGTQGEDRTKTKSLENGG